MFRSHQADMAGIPGMFGDGLMHWHGVSRALATHWYHVSVKRRIDGRFVSSQEMLNDEPKLHELVSAQGDDLQIDYVQVVTPARLNGTATWRMERLKSVSMGFDRNDCPVCLLEVESGQIYNDYHEDGFDHGSLRQVRELYRAPV
ncbi:hypothetical protein [Pseudomonas promysalinigenes]|uniref:Uncharacterized protein n=1 Tax=Pseudomonas promysalinigenes TaxID=485898 RepID=A0ABY6AIK4_9PSED|nr:hypothetical protein [Pseudomonas promysalinigenes]UXH38810.1 hypothetical protein N5C08_17800 [Pseudomonas promysalinigenes]